MAGIVLDQDAEKTLDAPEQRAMDHDRRMLCAVLADIEGTEALGKIEIELHGAALPLAADRISERVFELRAIKRALAGIEHIGLPSLFHGYTQGLLGFIPDLIGPDALLRPCRQLNEHVLEAEILIDREDKLVELHAFAGDLLR